VAVLPGRPGWTSQRPGRASLPGRLCRQRLKLLALDATDIALSKLERNAERAREDVLRLARAGYIDPQVLKDRALATNLADLPRLAAAPLTTAAC